MGAHLNLRPLRLHVCVCMLVPFVGWAVSSANILARFLRSYVVPCLLSCVRCVPLFFLFVCALGPSVHGRSLSSAIDCFESRSGRSWTGRSAGLCLDVPYFQFDLLLLPIS